MKPNPHVAILLCTYNSNTVFFHEQVDSLLNQTYKNFHIYIFDDSLDDEAYKIVSLFSKKYPSLFTYKKGLKLGFSMNFISAINSSSINADFYFLCDQDDVWFKEKIKFVIDNYSSFINSKKPFLYCGRTIYVDENLSFLEHSPLMSKKPSLNNALIQSIAGGNTMAFNQSLKDISKIFGSAKVVSHDWWLYILCELFDGKTVYDSSPKIYYRQHKNSIIGGNTSFKAQLKRLTYLLIGRFKLWNDLHIKALKPKLGMVNNKGKIRLINDFEDYKKDDLFVKIAKFKNLKLYRQSNFETFVIFIASLINKI